MFLSSILEIFAIIILGIFQLTSIPFIYYVKPDLTLLAVLAMSAYEKRWIRRIAWLIIAAAILKFTPGIDWRLALFTASAAFGMILSDYLPWKRPVNFLIAVAVSGFAVNLELFGLEWNAALREMGLDLIIGIIFFGLASVFYAKKKIN